MGDLTHKGPDKFSVTEHGLLCDPYGRRPATAAEQWAFREIERLRAALEICAGACYRDDYDLEYKPTREARIARCALEGK